LTHDRRPRTRLRTRLDLHRRRCTARTDL
jgi:hypothetical protein